MNINRYNYRRALPLIVQSLRESDYIAFDFEFSGLQSDVDTLSNHMTDSVELRYWKYKENITQFTPLQIGICGFKFNQSLNQLECFPYNFYLPGPLFFLGPFYTQNVDSAQKTTCFEVKVTLFKKNWSPKWDSNPGFHLKRLLF